jgi:hypothetical protein
MRLLFWKNKKKITRKKTNTLKPRSTKAANFNIKSQRRDDEILLKLDAIMTFMRKHDLDVKYRMDQLAFAKRILKENNLDEIIKEKLSQGMIPIEIVNDLVSSEACSRATAYRYISVQTKLLKVSQKSH